jgi:hypothetical protein
MAKRKEIIRVIDELPTGKRTPIEAKKWADTKHKKTPRSEDPVDVLFELRCLLDKIPHISLEERMGFGT